MHYHIAPQLLDKIRAPQFPAEAIALRREWRKRARDLSSAKEAEFQTRRELVEAKADAQTRVGHLENDKHYNAASWTAAHESSLDDARADLKDAVAELNEFDETHAATVTKPSREMSLRLRLNAEIVPEFEDWFRQLSAGVFFKHCEPDMPDDSAIWLDGGDAVIGLHARFVDDAGNVLDKIRAVHDAPLPVADALAKWKQQVDDIAHFGDGERRFHAMVSRYFTRW